MSAQRASFWPALALVSHVCSLSVKVTVLVFQCALTAFSSSSAFPKDPGQGSEPMAKMMPSTRHMTSAVIVGGQVGQAVIELCSLTYSHKIHFQSSLSFFGEVTKAYSLE